MPAAINGLRRHMVAIVSPAITCDEARNDHNLRFFASALGAATAWCRRLNTPSLQFSSMQLRRPEWPPCAGFNEGQQRTASWFARSTLALHGVAGVMVVDTTLTVGIFRPGAGTAWGRLAVAPGQNAQVPSGSITENFP